MVAHLRRRIQHFFEFMYKVTYLCYFFGILFGSNEKLCVLKQNLLHLSNNYVIKPIIMCARNNIFLPTSRCYSMMTKLCCFAAILRWFHHITKLRVPNIDSIIIFSLFKLFFGINSQWMPVTHLLALIVVPASTTSQIADTINQSILIRFTSCASTNHSFVIVLVLCLVQLPWKCQIA